MLFALGCGVVAALAAVAVARAELWRRLCGDRTRWWQGHPGRGLTIAVFKLDRERGGGRDAGAPGGIFSPSLATGAGIAGAAIAHLLHVRLGARDTIVLGMAGYLSGVVQAPLHQRGDPDGDDPRSRAWSGPLFLTALIAR